MLARALKTRGEGKDDRLVNRPERDDLSQRRPAACERSRLIKNESVDVAERLDRCGVAEEHAEPGGTTTGDHDGNRRRESQGARTGNDEHGDRVHQGVGEARLWADEPPPKEGSDRNGDDCGDEPSSNLIGESL